MTVLERDLALSVFRLHPLEAARELERLPAADGARFIASAKPSEAAACLRGMQGATASEILAQLKPEVAAEILAELPLDVSSACLRRMESSRRETLLEQVENGLARSLRSQLSFPPDTAGALMDPSVLALPEDLSVGEAVAKVRETARLARYNVYVVNRDQRLRGVFNLRELLLAERRDLLSSIARSELHRLPASADRHAIVSHPGWRDVHSLPVVDRDGVYLGAIRYRTLRRLEEKLRGGQVGTEVTARALGDLFRTGAGSLLEALTSPEAGAVEEESHDGA